MRGQRLVGSLPVRVGTLMLGLLCAALASEVDGGRRLAPYAAIGSGVLTWLGLVHSFEATFRMWTRFAAILHTVVITVMFTVCYLVVVPLFFVIVWLRDPLGLRRKGQATSWVARAPTIDASSLERMG